MKSFNLTVNTKIGFYLVISYLLLILFLTALIFILNEGGWILVLIGFITIFPFLPLILGLFVLITGNEQLMLIPTSQSSLLAMIIGGIINAFALFILGYFTSKLLIKKNIR